MFISFRVKFDKGSAIKWILNNMRFFCCQVYKTDSIHTQFYRVLVTSVKMKIFGVSFLSIFAGLIAGKSAI